MTFDMNQAVVTFGGLCVNRPPTAFATGLTVVGSMSTSSEFSSVASSPSVGPAFLNRILSKKPRNISRTVAQRLADTLGITIDEFTTGKPLLSGSIAEDNGWEVSGKLEGSPRETPNGVSFLVRKHLAAINCRHIIDSLVRKPGALPRSKALQTSAS